MGGGELETSLKNQIEELNLSDKVILIGSRPQNEVCELVQNSAVFAAPYIIAKDGNRDGLPTVLLEAMALGTPCIGTNITGIPELIRDGKTGLIVPQEDEKALAEALKQLLYKSDLRVKLAQSARHLLESEFDIHKNTALLRNLF